MKTVQGENRSYQLVQKTRRKDIDGIIYLVAGEKDIWVKILKDRSQQKEMEVRNQIANGYGAMFDIPLDIVMDSSGFTGYTFKGQEMEIVPVREENIRIPKEIYGQDSGRSTENVKKQNSLSDEVKIKQKRDHGQTSNIAKEPIIVLSGLILCGLLLFGINYFWLNMVIWKKFSAYIGNSIVQGGIRLSLNGIIPGVVGIAIIINALKHVIRHPIHVRKVLVLEIIIYLVSVFLTDIILALLVVIITAVLGTVQEYQSTIIIVIVVIFIIRGTLKK